MAVISSQERLKLLPNNEHRTSNWQLAGELMSQHFKRGSNLILDVDGVILQADALRYPLVTTPLLIPSLRVLETQHDVEIGLATARGPHIADYLRRQHRLPLSGPLILEEGQLLEKNGVQTHFSARRHQEFMRSGQRELELNRHFKQSWDEVVNETWATGALAFCHGDKQWQGHSRASFWFFADGNEQREQFLKDSIIVPTLSKLAADHDLTYEDDVAVQVSRMKGNHLGIIGIKGKINGEAVHKGIAAQTLDKPWVFVADGFGDQPMAQVTRKKGGLVIGIKGNLDDSPDAKEFLCDADVVLENPQEYAIALQYSALLLR